jgi:predicted kinase
MNYLVCTVGQSGCGKTTLGREFEKLGFEVVCPDDVRAELTGDVSNQSLNAVVFKIIPERIVSLLKTKDVFYSATNVKEHDWNAIRKWVSDVDCKIVWVVFDVNPKECLRRVKKDLESCNRADTTQVGTDNKTPVERQYERLHNLMNTMRIGGKTLTAWKTIENEVEVVGERIVFYNGQTIAEVLGND